MENKIEKFICEFKSLKESTDLLRSIIEDDIYKNKSKKTLEHFIDHLPQILHRIFSQHDKSSLIYQLENKDISYSDYKNFIRLFNPQEQCNLYTLLFNHNDIEMKYVYSISHINKMYKTFNDRKLSEIPFFNLCHYFAIQLEHSTKTNTIMLNQKEFFIIVFLNSLTQCQIFQNVELEKKFKNFEKGFKSDKTYAKFIEVNLNRNVIYNFFINIFNMLVTEFSTKKANKALLTIFASAVDFCWLDKFRYNFRYYEDHKECFDANILNIKWNQTQFSNFLNLAEVECMRILVKAVLSDDNLISFDNKEKQYVINKDAYMFIFNRNLYYMLKYAFIRLIFEKTFNHVTTYDLAELWYEFITPWTKCVRAKYDELWKSHTACIQQFIYSNILFYTDIFNDYIVCMSTCDQKIYLEDIYLLHKILSVFQNNHGNIINEYIKIDSLHYYIVSKNEFNNPDQDLMNICLTIDNSLRMFQITKNAIFPYNKPVLFQLLK
jgi:hypothetical protein